MSEHIDATPFRPSPLPPASDLPPYGSIESCVKCGCFDSTERYRNGDPEARFDGEHIVSVCRNCKFVWREQCADATKGDA